MESCSKPSVRTTRVSNTCQVRPCSDMHLDLRYPIGRLLTLFGVILAIQGLTVEAKVLSQNVKLYWGAAMTVCGLTALYFATVRLKPDPTVRGVKPDPTVRGVRPSGGPSTPEHEDAV